jgi:hypothetical protein
MLLHERGVVSQKTEMLKMNLIENILYEYVGIILFCSSQLLME